MTFGHFQLGLYESFLIYTELYLTLHPQKTTDLISTNQLRLSSSNHIKMRDREKKGRIKEHTTEKRKT